MSPQPHVLIVGGSYAGLNALNQLISLSQGKAPQEAPTSGPLKHIRPLNVKPRYTILDERDGFYHLVGAPLSMISSNIAWEFWVPFQHIIKTKEGYTDVSFVHGKATSLNEAAKKMDYKTPAGELKSIPYDYLIVATGMARTAPVVPTAMFRDQYLKDVKKLENELGQHQKIVLVGGGAVGIEMAAETKVHFPNADVSLIHSRSQLLSAEDLPDDFKAKAADLVRESGVNVILGQRVTGNKNVDGGVELTLSNGETMFANKAIFTAVQQGANTKFLPSQHWMKDDCYKTRDTLQFPEDLENSDVIYAAGDVVSWSGIKRSGPAGNMGKIAAKNIFAQMLAAEDGRAASEIEFEKLQPVTRASMSLAVGNQAMSNGGESLRWGPGVKQGAFGRALGLDGKIESCYILCVSNTDKMVRDTLETGYPASFAAGSEV
ncbi:FAD/NAD(P)-binding domain-containing protein [Microthyrium microscopicum]|uniref:FAD/NAD(P)-binding domain-containing protein n=1 Tax=Microthyrium microscopicum TaxID=703497 RepID=A0A6A6UQE8_9PEZI|nr:FAD/NAD(P)-binding domain-containing protein [Microthyrium microscopicum]